MTCVYFRFSQSHQQTVHRNVSRHFFSFCIYHTIIIGWLFKPRIYLLSILTTLGRIFTTFSFNLLYKTFKKINERAICTFCYNGESNPMDLWIFTIFRLIKPSQRMASFLCSSFVYRLCRNNGHLVFFLKSIGLSTQYSNLWTYHSYKTV